MDIIRIEQTSPCHKPDHEEWRRVNGFRRIFVSNRGRVKRIEFISESNGRFFPEHIYPTYNNKGYRKVIFSEDKVRYTKSVHTLVAEAFLGPRPHGKLVDHKDEDKCNNRSDNLQYLTPRENTIKSLPRYEKNLVRLSKERREKSRINSNIVKEIREKYKPYVYTVKQLCSEYNIKEGMMRSILERRVWKDI